MSEQNTTCRIIELRIFFFFFFFGGGGGGGGGDGGDFELRVIIAKSLVA